MSSNRNAPLVNFEIGSCLGAAVKSRARSPWAQISFNEEEVPQKEQDAQGHHPKHSVSLQEAECLHLIDLCLGHIHQSIHLQDIVVGIGQEGGREKHAQADQRQPPSPQIQPKMSRPVERSW